MGLPFLTSNNAANTSSDTGRLEALSDGIFAIAITLLGFQLAVPVLEAPQSNGRLWSAFLDLWPNYLSFVMSFTSILIMWINHHAIFRAMARMDKFIMIANGILLLFVTAVPFVTMMIAEYLRTDAAAMAVALYAGLFVLVNLSYHGLWWTICWGGRMLDPQADRRWIRSYSLGLFIALPLYLLATFTAFWNIFVSIAILVCLWLYWGMTPFDPTVRSRLRGE